MDVNKEVDRLEKAIGRGDEDEAIEIDNKLIIYGYGIRKELSSMAKEHADTMGFYFRDWIMNGFYELVYLFMIVVAFYVKNELLAVLSGGVGAVALIGTFLSRRQFAQFLSSDITRMRQEKIMANNNKLQLNYILSSRVEHTDFLEKARAEKMERNMETPEPKDEDER